jgi:GntR family transcriptional regulator/MocR family aminotransferase
VIYVGTFSKVLFPSMRVGYMVVPPDLLERFLSVRQTIDVSQSDLNQAVLSKFIQEGHFARHIRRLRAVYAERRSVLESSLRKLFGSELEIVGDESGMHLTVLLPEGMNDVQIAFRAATRNLWLWPLSPYYLGDSPRSGFLLGFGGVSADEIPRGVRLLHQVMHATGE